MVEFSFSPKEWVDICRRSEPLAKNKYQASFSPYTDAMLDIIEGMKTEQFNETNNETKSGFNETKSVSLNVSLKKETNSSSARVRAWRARNKERVSKHNKTAYQKRKTF